jgi:hypothetical protein
MIRSGLLVAAVSILAAAPAFAEGSPPLAPLVPVSKAPPILTWAGIGVHDVRFSTPFGTATDAEFGINVGAAVAVASLTPDVPLLGFGNVAMSFASGGQFLPLTLGAAARYDKLPLKLLGGLGGTVMINTGGSNTGLGVGILLMALYPLVQVDPRLSVQGQIQYHLMTNSLSLLVFNIGVGYAL